ncbi:proclotting enzyme isoform X2 [Hyalella azteca]|uniref:limulus clotting factor C n=1 Tax=Hyalella azteca TaxID=294128 RepID=A0A8B7NX95_HYAAZ|nr:proclotting enzyme isoform X2 [Hyalella azteca]
MFPFDQAYVVPYYEHVPPSVSPDKLHLATEYHDPSSPRNIQGIFKNLWEKLLSAIPISLTTGGRPAPPKLGPDDLYWLNGATYAVKPNELESSEKSAIYENERAKEFLDRVHKEQIATNSDIVYFNTRRSIEYPLEKSVTQKVRDAIFPPKEMSRERLSQVCGISKFIRRSRRLVNGRISAEGQWPWMAYVMGSATTANSLSFRQRVCGGVLITDRHVISASHCWKLPEGENFAYDYRVYVQLGTTGVYDASKIVFHPDRYLIKKMYKHKGFDESQYLFDISIFELVHQVTFTKNVIPVCLPKPGQNFNNELGFVVGWGMQQYNSTRPSTAQRYVDVPIVPHTVCQDWYGESNITISSQHLCAGFQEGGKDACKGDSGGPLAVRGMDGRWTLAGTVSYGFGCAEPRKPGLYNNITLFLPWIHNIINRPAD